MGHGGRNRIGKIRFALPGVLFVLLASGEAFARLGGGQSWGGGGSGGGGGGDGGGEILFYIAYLLFRLCVRHPYIGIPLLLLAVIGFVLYRKSRTGSARLSPFSSGAPERLLARRRGADLDRLRADDPNFSRPLFLDFVQLLYTRAQNARGTGGFDPVRPYLMPDVIRPWEKERAEPGLAAVRDVIVGRSDIIRVQVVPRKVNFVTVEFEANFAEDREDGAVDFYIVERWTFRRNAGVLSRGPEEIRTLSCPGCGSPVELDTEGRCTYCGRAAGTGAFHWVVSNVLVMQKSRKPPPLAGRGGGEEAGIERSTVFQKEFAALRKTFQAKHPDFSWKAFSRKVQVAFLELQEAWSTGQFEKARPFESDPLFNAHRFWIERFGKEGLSNRLEEVEIQKILPCRIETDAFYEAITVRIFAGMLDYTTDGAGKVVEGSKSKKRRFSEYWTFVRRIGAKEGKEEGADRCPSCGAPVQVNMAGECGYCGSKVTNGDFDWVLSSIEQDELYSG